MDEKLQKLIIILARLERIEKKLELMDQCLLNHRVFVAEMLTEEKGEQCRK